MEVHKKAHREVFACKLHAIMKLVSQSGEELVYIR